MAKRRGARPRLDLGPPHEVSSRESLGPGAPAGKTSVVGKDIGPRAPHLRSVVREDMGPRAPHTRSIVGKDIGFEDPHMRSIAGEDLVRGAPHMRSIVRKDPRGPSRRSLLWVDESLLGPGLLDHLGRADSFSDENILRSVAATCQGPLPGVIEALALEVRGHGGGAGEEALVWRRSVCVTELAREFLEEGREEELLEEGKEVQKIVGDILEEMISRSVEESERNSVVRYSHFYHPLANSEDISRMTGTLEATRLGLQDGRTRLEEAYRIILVQAARQLVVSYRNILLHQTSRLEDGRQREVGEDTVAALMEVTREVAELTVEYLKAATRSVVDRSVEEVRGQLGGLEEEL